MSEFQKALDELRCWARPVEGNLKDMESMGRWPGLRGVIKRLLNAEPPREMTEAERAWCEFEKSECVRQALRDAGGVCCAAADAAFKISVERSQQRTLSDVTAELKGALESKSCLSGTVHRLSGELLRLLEAPK